MIEADIPVGTTLRVRVTVPLKPLVLDRVTLAVAEPAHPRASMDGLAAIEKSGCDMLLLKVAV